MGKARKRISPTQENPVTPIAPIRLEEMVGDSDIKSALVHKIPPNRSPSPSLEARMASRRLDFISPVLQDIPNLEIEGSVHEIGNLALSSGKAAIEQTKAALPNQEVRTKGNWASIFSENRNPANCERLDYIQPSYDESGNPFVSYGDEDLEIDHWVSSLIGYAVGAKVSYKQMESYSRGKWSLMGNPLILQLERGVFLFKFDSLDNMQQVLLGGPWFYRWKTTSPKTVVI
jgi:hypothetical protein